MDPNQSSLKKAPQPCTVTISQVEQLLAIRETQKGLKGSLKLIDEAIMESTAPTIHRNLVIK